MDEPRNDRARATAPKNDVNDTRPAISNGTILRAVAIGLAAFYALKLAGRSIEILFTGFLGLLFGLNLSAAADYFQRFRIPRAVSAGGVVLLIFGLLGGAGALLAPTLREQATSLRQQLPNAIDALDARLQRAGIRVAAPATPVSQSASASSDSAQTPDSSAASTDPSTSQSSAESGSSPSALRQQLVSRAGSLITQAGTFVSTAASALAGVFIVSFIAIFYAIEPALYRDGALHLVPHRHRKRVRDTLSGTSIVLRRWLTAQLLAMLLIGVLSTIAYLIIGVKAPLALGLIAGICEFVPFVGPVAAALPAMGMAAVDGGDKVLYVALASLAIQQAEEVLIVPLLMKNNLEMPPILTILAQGTMGVAFGIMGLLVAVPMLAGIMVPIKMLYVEDSIGDPMDVDANGPVKREK